MSTELITLAKSDFTGSESDWATIKASAMYVVTAGDSETVVGDSPEIEDAYVTASGKEPYGPNAHYADDGWQPDGKKRYPLDTPSHVRSAHSYFSKPSNYERYTPEQRSKIRARIHAAWVKLIDPKGPPSDQK